MDYGCLRLSVSNFVEFFENLSSLVEDRWGKMSLQKRVNRRTILSEGTNSVQGLYKKNRALEL